MNINNRKNIILALGILTLILFFFDWFSIDAYIIDIDISPSSIVSMVEDLGGEYGEDIKEELKDEYGVDINKIYLLYILPILSSIIILSYFFTKEKNFYVMSAIAFMGILLFIIISVIYLKDKYLELKLLEDLTENIIKIKFIFYVYIGSCVFGLFSCFQTIRVSDLKNVKGGLKEIGGGLKQSANNGLSRIKEINGNNQYNNSNEMNINQQYNNDNGNQYKHNYGIVESKPVNYQIRMLAGSQKGRTFPLKAGKTKIGRELNEADIVINNSTISRLHCELYYDGSANLLVIKDFSKNGTFINGVRISLETMTKVNEGDIIEFGNRKEKMVIIRTV